MIRKPKDASAITRPSCRLKVLLLTHYYPAHRGGVEIVAGQLAHRLGERYAIQWMAADCDPTPQDSKLDCRPQAAWNGLEKKGLPWPVWSIRGLAQLKQAIAACDVLHVHDFIYPAHLLAVPLARWLGRPVLITQHIGDIDYKSRVLRTILRGINRSVGRWMLGLASQVVFISPKVKARFESYTRFHRPPLYWPNGVDTDIFCPVDPQSRHSLKQAIGLNPDKPILLFVGRFVEKKGLLLLQQLAQSRPDWQWCFAGWGPLNPSDWAMPQVRVWSGLEGKTLAPLYQLADLLILPSYGEGFPLVVQEALACGTPVMISEDTAAGGPSLPGSIIPVPYSPQTPNPTTWLNTIQDYFAQTHSSEQRPQIAKEAARRWQWDSLADDYGLLYQELIQRI